MSGTGPNQKQFSPGEAYRVFMASSLYIAVGAAVCILLALLLPVVGVSATVMGVSQGGSASGSQAAGLLGWLTLAAFAAAAAARYVPTMFAYRRLIDYAAFAMAAAAVLWAVFGGDLATGMKQMRDAQSQLSSLAGPAGARGAPAPGISVSVYPHVGVLFVLLGVGLLAVSHRRENLAP